MWAFVASARRGRKGKTGHNSAVVSRPYRPDCGSLEDRALLAVSLSTSLPVAPVVGLPVELRAAAKGDGAQPIYQFSVSRDGGAFQVVSDYSYSNHFTWDPLQEGSYSIQVNVKDNFFDAVSDTASATYIAGSRVVGNQAVVNPTSNPLVALYSAPPTAGNSMVVQYSRVGSTTWNSTSPQPIVPGESTNILVAGMYPNTNYVMRDVVDNGTPSAPVTFKTGSLPSYLKFPSYTVEQAPTPGTNLGANVVFHVGMSSSPSVVSTLATDLKGNVIWYYDAVAHDYANYAPSIVPGGTVLMLGGSPLDGRGGTIALREVNLVGDTVRQTNIAALNEELVAMGQPTIYNLSHDAQRLPNGDTAVIAGTTQVANDQGKPTTYYGDMVLVLDQNFQVVWTWNPFQWLNTNRLPTLNEGPADWTHANSITWSPEDGDLLLSLRSQDWVVKIDYANGAGDGHVVWRLGKGGDFNAISSDPSPWFSHQHDVKYINNNTVVVFDDGNTRRSTDPNADSRGQEWVLNEQTMTATLVANVDLGSYSSYLGSAQGLPNGNLVFGSPVNKQTIEVTPSGTTLYVLQDDSQDAQYRSYMYNSLYGNSVTQVNPYNANLAAAYNRTGIVNDNALVGSGLDGKGKALSSTQIGSSVVAGNVKFPIGAAGTPNVISAAGQTIALPVGNDNALKLLATGVNGDQKNQVFKVTYTDGTTQKFKQSLSNWAAPRYFPGETTALTTIYINVSGQGPQPGAYNLYEYSLKLNPRKKVQSITLPRNANVDVFSVALVPASTSSPSQAAQNHAASRPLRANVKRQH